MSSTVPFFICTVGGVFGSIVYFNPFRVAITAWSKTMTEMNVFNRDTFALDAEGCGSQLAAAGSLLEKVKKFLEQTRVSLPPKDQFLKIVADAYDTYVAPIDIPGVPNIVEPWVDNALRAIVLQQSSMIYDYFSTVA